MFYSKNKRLYDLILSKINANTQKLENGNPVVASGNYMFVFNNQQVGSHNFEIVSRDADALDFKSTEFIPLVDVQSIQIPFVETNKRDDWEREFYVAIKMPKTRNAVTKQMEIVFDESNPRYQAILEMIENLSDTLTFVEGDYKYTFKVKEPTKVSVFTYNNTKYQVLALTFNLTSLSKGFFGNETKIYLGELSDTSFGETAPYLLDNVEFNEIVGKTTRATSNVNSTEEAYQVDKRIWQSTITVNFNGNLADMLIYKEKALISAINKEYQIKITNKNLNTLVGENLDYTINVLISNVNITYQNNVVSQLTFKLERA
jgi:hypothetical protein